jgi:hypothetical protein
MTIKQHHDDKSEHAPLGLTPAKEVRVKCIVDSRPWTDIKALDRGEEADVPEELAKVLEERKLVERVK